MSHFIIGTAGHVDHGKSTLIRALTGLETDRLKEEKKRGITIELGFAYLDLPNGERAGIVDVPGHEKFISNMLAGAGGMDLVLLIVAADEGVMPQTREHFDILKLLNIRRGLIVLTKKDMVDEDWLSLIEDDVRSLVVDSFLEDAPIMAVSSTSGAGIPELRAKIFDELERCQGKREDAAFREAIDRVFTMEGFGTVVTGTITEGTVSLGDELMLYPEEQRVRVRSIQVHGQDQKMASAGQRAAINLAQIGRDEVLRGDTLATAASLDVSDFWETELKVLDDSPFTIKTSTRVHVHYGSAQVLARLRIFGREELRAGESGLVRLQLERPLAAKANDRFVLRFYSPLETVAGGRILDPAPRQRKVDPERQAERLAAWAKGSETERLYLSMATQSLDLQSVQLAYRRAGLSDLTSEEREAFLNDLLTQGRLIALKDQKYLTDEQLHLLAERAEKILSAFHAENPLKLGLKREEMRTRLLPQMALDLSDRILTALEASGILVSVQGLLALPSHQVARSPEQERIQEKMLTLYREARFSPPSTAEVLAQFPAKAKASELLADLLDQGKLLRLENDMNLAAEYMLEAEQIVRRLCAEGPMKLADFRTEIETSRKYAVPILEYFDRQKLTRMVGEARVLYAAKA